MNFPIVINYPLPDPLPDPPPDGAPKDDPAKLYYVLASNGLFQVRITDAFRATTRVEGGVPGLDAEIERVDMRFPRLPADLVGRVVAFFEAIYERYGSEAMVLLFYCAAERRFEVGIPPQTVSGYRDSSGRFWPDYRLDYGTVPRPEGFLRFGSIHSHAGLAAYASGIDCEDERYEDGLHVVFGHFGKAAGRKAVSSHASFVAGGRRFPVEVEDAVEIDAAALAAATASAEWIEQVGCMERGPGGRSAYGVSEAGSWSYDDAGPPRSQHD